MDIYAFPPQGLDWAEDERYHQIIKAHSEKLITLSKETKINYKDVLKLIDPATNSISFLAMLVFASDNAKDAPPELGDHIIQFLVSFDPRQTRYGGPALMNICTHILSPALVPTSIAIDAVAIALQKIDPSGSVLTPAHIALVEAAVKTSDNETPSLLAVISKPILFYPGMYNQVPKSAIAADMSLPASYFMQPNSGIVAALKPCDVIRYDLFCGMIHASRRDWQSAYDCWMRCATHPSKDGGVSLTMVCAYKRLVLASLLLKGRIVQLPSNTNVSAQKVYDVMGKPYTTLAGLFESTNAKELIRHAQECQKIWENDQTMGLVAECLESYQKWKIIDLRNVYTKIYISEVRSETQSGQTGKKSSSDAEAETLVGGMISSGMLRGELGTTEDGRTYLEFLSEKPVLSEDQYHEKLLASAQRLKEMEPLWKLADDRVTTSKEHIKHLIRMDTGNKKRGVVGVSGAIGPVFNPGGFIDPGFEDPMEDEDLMGDGY